MEAAGAACTRGEVVLQAFTIVLVVALDCVAVDALLGVQVQILLTNAHGKVLRSMVKVREWVGEGSAGGSTD